MVIRNESTIESLNASVATHSATITTLQNTLTQVNGLKAQLEAQVQNLQVSFYLFLQKRFHLLVETMVQHILIHKMRFVFVLNVSHTYTFCINTMV